MGLGPSNHCCVKVGGPILVTNSPREQKKKRVHVYSILVDRKKYIFYY